MGPAITAHQLKTVTLWLGILGGPQQRGFWKIDMAVVVCNFNGSDVALACFGWFVVVGITISWWQKLVLSHHPGNVPKVVLGQDAIMTPPNMGIFRRALEEEPCQSRVVARCKAVAVATAGFVGFHVRLRYLEVLQVHVPRLFSVLRLKKNYRILFCSSSTTIIRFFLDPKFQISCGFLDLQVVIAMDCQWVLM